MKPGYFCTDCQEDRRVLRPDGRCTICGGARIEAERREAKEMADVAGEYDLDPLGDFVRDQTQKK